MHFSHDCLTTGEDVPLNIIILPGDVGTGFLDLTPELIAELIAPQGWAEILEQYARTMRMAVALIDSNGQLVGSCHNPQPIWSLARNALPHSPNLCLFCLETSNICSAAAD